MYWVETYNDDSLRSSLTPPSSLVAVFNSLGSLAEKGLLDEPEPDANLTALGGFVGSLGVDLRVGRVVGLGVQLDVAAAACMLAAAMSAQAPWRVASPLVHKDPDEYNYLMTSSFLSKTKFDAGIYSQPISLVRLLLKYRKEKARAKNPGEYTNKFVQNNSLAHKRLHLLVKVYENLLSKVERLVGKPVVDDSVPDPAKDPGEERRGANDEG